MLGLLRRQVAVTIEGLDALRGVGRRRRGRGAGRARRRAPGDAAKRELLSALRVAFVTPLEPEDVFALSRGIDRILNHARDLINESEAMACPPDARIAEMASLLGEALRHIDDAIAPLGSDGDEATAAADAAITPERRLEHAYYEGMAGLLEVEDRQRAHRAPRALPPLLADRRDRGRRRRARRLRRREAELSRQVGGCSPVDRRRPL